MADDPAVLADVDVILSGWACPRWTRHSSPPRPTSRACFTARVDQAHGHRRLWALQIPITSAYAANAVPVIEYALAQILLSLKRTWHYMFAIRAQGQYIPRTPVPGAHGSTVGIISLGMIGSGVAQKLQQFDVRAIAYDPFVKPERRRTGCGTLLARRRLPPRRCGVAPRTVAR
ncbi:MAG: NAD(P)-dependent oxidoreductase [Caldilineaceae bacterium]